MARLIALLTLGSGLLNLWTLLFRLGPRWAPTLEAIFPLEVQHASRFITLVVGFALIVSSINIFKRKRRAFLLVLGLSAASIVFHLTKGLNYEAAAVSVLVVAALVATRHEFTVKSGNPDMTSALERAVIAVAVVLAYGVAGFWSLDRRDFGIDFDVADALRMTVEYLTLGADPRLLAHTRHAVWFLDSLNLIALTAIAYTLSVFYGPTVYRFLTLPRERAHAVEILGRHGRSPLDFFKSWPDKSFFFSPSRESFVAYRVDHGYAIALGDPVGPAAELESTIDRFRNFCDEQDWRVAFHQTLPDFAETYRRRGFKLLKVGDDAIVDLERFTLEGSERKSLRHAVSKLERQGVRAEVVEPPVPEPILAQLKEVSDEWLRLAGHRERRFTLGRFEHDYVRRTPLFVALDSDGRVLAFVNLIPAYVPGDLAIDLMRRRDRVPNGTMEFLFSKLLLEYRARGFRRFNLGLAPMAGFQEGDEASREERALHAFFQRFNFLFNYRGLKQFKGKFATGWEPRYLAYGSALDLPRFAIALAAVTRQQA